MTESSLQTRTQLSSEPSKETTGYSLLRKRQSAISVQSKYNCVQLKKEGTDIGILFGTVYKVKQNFISNMYPRSTPLRARVGPDLCPETFNLVFWRKEMLHDIRQLYTMKRLGLTLKFAEL